MAAQPSFESSLKALEAIVEKLDDGGVPLEEALKIFEEGRRHAKVCSDTLNAVERRIQILLENPEGEATAQDFDIDKALGNAKYKDDFPG